MDFFDMSRIVAGGDESVTRYLQDHRMSVRDLNCIPCGCQYTKVKKAGSITGYMLCCPGCKKKHHLTTGTFFSRSHLSMSKVFALIYFWAFQTSCRHTSSHLSISSATVVQWYQYCRDICSWKLLATPVQLGGVCRCVQIDETLLVKAKYHRGHQLRAKQRWVFGIYDPQSKEGYMELVDKRDAATLLPIIQRIVIPGTTVWSDQWAAYGQLAGLGYNHQTVNHSQNFKDLVIGVCTNHVEAYWMSVKRRFKQMMGTAAEMVPSYLDEHMWCEQYGQTPQLAMINLQHHIAERYPLP